MARLQALLFSSEVMRFGLLDFCVNWCFKYRRYGGKSPCDGQQVLLNVTLSDCSVQDLSSFPTLFNSKYSSDTVNRYHVSRALYFNTTYPVQYVV